MVAGSKLFLLAESFILGIQLDYLFRYWGPDSSSGEIYASVGDIKFDKEKT